MLYKWKKKLKRNEKDIKDIINRINYIKKNTNLLENNNITDNSYTINFNYNKENIEIIKGIINDNNKINNLIDLIKKNNYNLIQRIIKKNKLNLSYNDFNNSIIEVFPVKSKKIINDNKKSNNSYDNNIINYIKNKNFDIYLNIFLILKISKIKMMIEMKTLLKIIIMEIY